MTDLDRKPLPPFRARGDRPPRPRADGGSLLELLLASLIFEVALLALAPLFVRALGDVSFGAQRAQAAALAAGRLEAIPKPGAPRAPRPGSRREVYSQIERRWLSSPPPPPDRILWVATETVRSYPLSSIEDGSVTPAEALAEPDPDPASGVPAARLESRRIVMSRTVGGPELLTLEAFEWSVD